MTSTLYIRGRAVAGREHRSDTARLSALCPRCGLAKGRSGVCLRCDGVTPGRAAEPDPEAVAPLRQGEPWADDDGVIYRVVPDRVISAEGWATSAVWGKKLGCTWRALEWMIGRGAFDAAIGVESGERRYRCLSPRRCSELLVEWGKRKP